MNEPIYEILGTSRDASTRALRRRFKRKTKLIRLGTLVVRSGRRLRLSPAGLAKYLDGILEGMRVGDLKVLQNNRVLDAAAVREAAGASEALDTGPGPEETKEFGEETTSPEIPSVLRPEEPVAPPEEPVEDDEPEEDDDPTDLEDAASSEEEPEAELSPKAVPAAEPLPEGWEDFKKKDLLALIDERGIEVPLRDNGKPDERNATLLKVLALWEQENS